jgi:5-methylcytosine-specific restriction endonuclease McrA
VPWLRVGDTSAHHPVVVGVLEHPSADDRLLNECFGFVCRCATQATAHTTDYVVNFGTALSLAGSIDRAKALLEVAVFAGYMTKGQAEGRDVYKIVDDPKFLHMRTREEIDWETQRKVDNSNPAVIVPVRLRDGDACRYCGLVVSFAPGSRSGLKSGTYDHRIPGKAATVETCVVACRSCNASRKDDPAADVNCPLRNPPSRPYYSEHTREWFAGNAWAKAWSATSGLTLPAHDGHQREMAPGDRPMSTTVSSPSAPAEQDIARAAGPSPGSGLPAPGSGLTGAAAGLTAKASAPGRDGSGQEGTGRGGSPTDSSPRRSRSARRASARAKHQTVEDP